MLQSSKRTRLAAQAVALPAPYALQEHVTPERTAVLSRWPLSTPGARPWPLAQNAAHLPEVVVDFPKEKGVTVATTWGLRSSPPAERVWKAPRRRGSGQQSRTAASRLVPSAPLLPTDEGLPGRPATTGLWWGRLPEGPLEPAGMARAQGQRGRSTAGGEPAPSTLQPVAPPAHARPPRPNCCWSNHVGGAGSGATRGNSNVQKDGGRAVGHHPPEAPRPGRTAVAPRNGPASP